MFAGGSRRFGHRDLSVMFHFQGKGTLGWKPLGVLIAALLLVAIVGAVIVASAIFGDRLDPMNFTVLSQ
jgi:hypothetical protein